MTPATTPHAERTSCRKKTGWPITYPLFVFFLLLVPLLLHAWPLPGEWIPVYKNSAFLQDPQGDAQGSRNIVSDSTHSAAYIFNDGVYVYFRLRLDKDPTGQGGQGLLQPYGWGVEIDSNLNAANYEFLVMLDGISQTENISFFQNTVQETLGDPSDKAEVLLQSLPILGNYLISPADTAINGDQDYFLDWRFPYSALKQAGNFTDSTPLRLFFGSSPSTNNLTDRGADLVGGSDLYSGFSDYITPFGLKPTTGAVIFAADSAGNGHVTQMAAGDPLYIRVTDADRNTISSSIQTLQVVLTTQNGDSLTLTLQETGPNTGIFTGSVSTASAKPVTGDNVLQIMPGETVTVTYIDTVDANLAFNQARTDSVQAFPPVLAVTKTVNPGTAGSGGTVIYTVTITNSGDGDGWLTSLSDVLPRGFSYVKGSTTGFAAFDPLVNGQSLLWTGSWIVPHRTGGVNGSITLSFTALAGSVMGTFFNNATASGANFGSITSGDTAPVVVAAPLMALVKTTDRASALPGQDITYAVVYKNSGNFQARFLLIVDTIPPDTSYVAGSLRIGSAGASYAASAPKTDAAGDDEAETDGVNVLFRIPVVAADDGVQGSGPDEGIVYFKVKVK